MLGAISSALRGLLPAVYKDGALDFAQREAVHSALNRLRGEYPGDWAEEIRKVNFLPLEGSGAEALYQPKVRDIELGEQFRGDPRKIFELISHETSHLRDDLEGLPYGEALPYWLRPGERRAWETQYLDTSRYDADLEGQPFLFDRGDQQLLAHNLVDYNMDTIAMQKALEGGTYPLASWQSLRTPQQQKLPWD